MLFCHEFVQLISEPTRGDNILDLVFSNHRSLISDISVQSPLGNSDHASISFDINASGEEWFPIKRRQFTKCKYEAICYLYSADWAASVGSVSSVNDKYSMFLAILNHTIDMFVPCAYTNLDKSQLPLHLRNMLSHKKCLFNHAKLSGDWTGYHRFSKLFSK